MRPFVTILWVALALVVAGCSSGSPSTDGDASLFRCAADSDCSDGQDCTIDSCGVSGTCSFTPVDERCAAGESCVAGRGCVAGTTCDADADCDDSIACTIDSCGIGGTCRQMPIHERCTDPTAPMCDPLSGCTAGSGCAADGDCDDSIACTLDTCGADMACRNMPIDARCASGETCSPTAGCFTPMPCTTAAECQDDNFCNGAEICMPEFGCAPAEAPRACDDSDSCTVDSCDAASDMCVFACDASRTECGCTPPPDGCSGRFALTGATMYECLPSPLTGETMSGYDFSEVMFMNHGVAVTAQPLRFWTTSTGLSREYRDLILTDNDAPVCPMVDATSGDLSGDCVENYRLVGSFTDMDTFVGRIHRTYTGSSCATYGCISGTADVTGTRIP